MRQRYSMFFMFIAFGVSALLLGPPVFDSLHSLLVPIPQSPVPRSGVVVDVIKAGNGPQPKPGQKITVHCTGYLHDGMQKFWSTKDPDQEEFTFVVGRRKVIKGWDKGMLEMHLGETARLTMSGDHGYGSRGFPTWGIPPNAALVFDIELLKIE